MECEECKDITEVIFENTEDEISYIRGKVEN